MAIYLFSFQRNEKANIITYYTFRYNNIIILIYGECWIVIIFMYIINIVCYSSILIKLMIKYIEIINDISLNVRRIIFCFGNNPIFGSIVLLIMLIILFKWFIKFLFYFVTKLANKD